MGSGHTHEAPLKGSYLGRLNALAKLVTILPTIVLLNAVGHEHWRWVLVAAGVFAVMLISTGAQALGVLRRGAYLLPFAAFVAVTVPFAAAGSVAFRVHLGFATLVATDEGLRQAGDVALKAGASILGILVLTGTTQAPELFQALRSMGVPKTFVAVMSMIYRYFFEFGSELARLRQAAAARCFDMTTRKALPRMGTMAGALLVRSVVRSENVHRAMLARGFDGEMRGMNRARFGAAEAAFIAVFYAGIAAGVLLVSHA